MEVANQIKPSELKSWAVVKEEPKKHSVATKAIKQPDWYSYYERDGLYYPHRKPTISEIVNDRFK
jgi:hypothetical protein